MSVPIAGGAYRKSERLRLEDHRWVHKLSHECRDRGADPHAWRMHLGSELGRHVGTGLAIVVEMGPRSDGLPESRGETEWGWSEGFNRDGWVLASQLFEKNPKYSPTLNAYFAKLIGKPTATYSRADLMSNAEYDRSIDRDLVNRTVGVEHVAYSFQQIGSSPGEYTGMICPRAAGDRDYSPREKALLAEVNTVLAPMVGRYLKRFGEPSSAELAPRAREVLDHLLDGAGDKDVAKNLGISRHTVNQHIKSIFRHFGIRSRSELLARWIPAAGRRV